ncbi:MAG: SGNH/GDSL hydrolase family protein [Myxococcaceae bacterium]|nr:SGNH/GDSL hydrolase family protein [Myxococcaceae bacterium]MCI0673208.1 SGNH/GDSL hydrolase family protein [Myxococcaceae bacterium]
MPLGDSITLGVNGGYRKALRERLIALGCDVDLVGSQSDTHSADREHEGHSGFSIARIAEGVDGWLGAFRPDYVLLMVGTNDVAWWCTRPVQEIADEHARLVDRILARRPEAWLIVGSIPPLGSKTVGPGDVDRALLGRELSAAIRTRVEERQRHGKRIRFADVASVLDADDLSDGVHPVEAAHAEVANVWFEALGPVISCAHPATCAD